MAVKKRKKKSKIYFGTPVQEAIVEYNLLDQVEQSMERNKIYSERIHAAFMKLTENIINTFKFPYFDVPFIDVQQEVLSFLIMNMHKYDHTKGFKAFSYFSVVAKNYLILNNNQHYKRFKTKDDISVLNNRVDDSANLKNYINEFTEAMIEYFDKHIPSLFKKKKDIDVAYAILELLKRRHEIENFNKKSLYILIREMTNVNTAKITGVITVLKKHYKKIHNEFNLSGQIKLNDLKKNKNIFF